MDFAVVIDWVFALAPIVLFLVLWVRFRWGAAKASAAGWLATMFIAFVRFGAGLDLLALAQTKGWLLSLDGLLIVWATWILMGLEAGGMLLTMHVS